MPQAFWNGTLVAEATMSPSTDAKRERLAVQMKASGLPEEQARALSSADRNRLVYHNNQYGENYMKMIGQLKKEGQSDKQIAQAVRHLVQTGEVPGSMAHMEGRLHELQRTMFSAEGTRARSAALYSAMSLDMIEKGNFSAEAVFGRRRTPADTVDPRQARFPATGKGTQSAMALLEAGVDPDAKNEHLTSEERRNVRSVARRQEALAEEWLRLHGLYGLCIESRDRGLQLVTERLKAWFKGGK